MSTAIFIQEYSEKKRAYLTANVIATFLDGSSEDLYRNVWSVTLDCGVYIIRTKSATFTTPATGVELNITTED